jgi:hypothetical protein
VHWIVGLPPGIYGRHSREHVRLPDAGHAVIRLISDSGIRQKCIPGIPSTQPRWPIPPYRRAAPPPQSGTTGMSRTPCTTLVTSLSRKINPASVATRVSSHGCAASPTMCYAVIDPAPSVRTDTPPLSLDSMPWPTGASVECIEQPWERDDDRIDTRGASRLSKRVGGWQFEISHAASILRCHLGSAGHRQPMSAQDRNVTLGGSALLGATTGVHQP